MNFNFRRTVFIPANMDSVWDAVTDQRFECDFFPEITRKSSAGPVVSEIDATRSMSWESGTDIAIDLTRKDLNVTIEAVQLSFKPRGRGVDATIRLTYSKQLEKHFILAHRAIRHLFSVKLDVLKSDCVAAEPGCFQSVSFT